MNSASRALIGALLGALFVLFIHPKSRPFLIGGFGTRQNDLVAKATRNLPENLGKLPSPKDLDEASLWLQAAAEQELTGKKLSVDQALILAEIADQGTISEPENAFWHQMESVYSNVALKPTGKNETHSLQSWANASECHIWNDHQTDRLRKVAQTLGQLSGTEFSWHTALAYSRRSQATTERMIVQSRALFAATKGSLTARVSNIRNGSLIRDGAKSIRGGLIGSTMVQLGVFDVNSLRNSTSPRTMFEAKGRLLMDLQSNPETKRQIAHAIAANEAWLAFAPIKSYREIAVSRARFSLITATLPSSLLGAGVFGALVYLIGGLLSRRPQLLKYMDQPWAFLVGVCVGLATYLLTGLAFNALWMTAALCAFGISPDRVKAGSPYGLGVVYRSVLAVLAIGVCAGLSIHFIESSVPVNVLGEFAAVPRLTSEGSSVPLNLAFLGTSFVVVTAPIWGYLYRFSAKAVLPVSLMAFGSVLCIGAVSAAVIATPACLALDRQLNGDWSQMLENEPSHYLAHPSR